MLSHWFWYAHISLVLALVLALSMVLGMVPALADEPTDGSITINSPIMGAKYHAYKVFDLGMDNASAPTAYAYTISGDSPFYKAVASYAEAHSTEITLTEAIPATDPKTYNVTDAEALDAQAFGQWLRARLAESYEGEDKIEEADDIDPAYSDDEKGIVTPDDAESITFDGLEFGYYLITNEYDDRQNDVEVKLGGSDDYKFTIDDLEYDEDEEEYKLTAAAETKVNTYVTTEQYPDADAAKAYVEAHASQFAKTWDDMEASEKSQVLTDLQDSAKKSAIGMIIDKIVEAISDDNAKEITERWVFVDSTNPDAVINEKNEIHKWDVPVNPEGSSDLPDIPDHDEPKGGKNIVVGQDEDGNDIYAHSTETNIGGKVHYQLSINAVNFERDENGKVQQIKEYIVADYQNENMTWSEDDGIQVRVVLKDKDGNINGDDPLYNQMYTAWESKKGYFFANDEHTTVDNGVVVFDGSNGGIVIPWVEILTEDEAEGKDNVVKNVSDKLDDDGNKIPVYRLATTAEVEDGKYVAVEGVNYYSADGTATGREQATDAITHQPIWETETFYSHSLYPNDATILIDYYMTLDDTAVVDGDGNKNVAQYGVNYVTPEDKEYTPDEPNTPPEEPKEPEHKKEKQDAIVYTYALAIQKVDQYGNHLAGAKFELKGVTTAPKGTKGWYKVTAYDRTDAATWGTEMETDDDGLLVVEGLPQKWAVEVQETEAPVGYNKLTETQFIKPVKTGTATTASSTETWTDVDGNVTEITTSSTVYKDASGDVIAKMNKVGSVVTYEDGEGNEKTEEEFNELIANKFNKVDKTDVETTGTIATLTVENNRGTELPETGGIGTTIFYIAGSILVLAAAILLVTKRRMGAED